jgi:hypothetical protein
MNRRAMKTLIVNDEPIARRVLRESCPNTADTIIAKTTIKGEPTSCYSQMPRMDEISPATLNVVTDLAVCSNTIGAPHEYFDQTGINPHGLP